MTSKPYSTIFLCFLRWCDDWDGSLIFSCIYPLKRTTYISVLPYRLPIYQNHLCYTLFTYHFLQTTHITTSHHASLPTLRFGMNKKWDGKSSHFEMISKPYRTILSRVLRWWDDWDGSVIYFYFFLLFCITPISVIPTSISTYLLRISLMFIY